MRITSFFDSLVSRVEDWAKSHESFIAVKVTRLLALVFIIVSFLFLIRSFKM